MDSPFTEASRLLSSGSSPSEEPRPRPQRSVTFNPNPVVQTIDSEQEPERRRPLSSPRHHQYGPLAPSSLNPSAIHSSGFGGGPPVISALNNKLRRRNSYGAPSSAAGAAFPGPGSLPPSLQPKIGPQRSSKTAQKLKLLPNPEIEEIDLDEERGGDVYSQYTRIKDPSARRDAARLGKADRDRLPRVTAFCTANRYQMEGLMRFLKGRGKTRGANPKLIDECIYTPYCYSSKQAEAPARSERHVEVQPAFTGNHERRRSTGEVAGADGEFHREDLIDLRGEDRHGALGGDYDHDGRLADESAIDNVADLDIRVHTPEVFLFEYGVVVIWGMSLVEEQRFLKEIAKFEIEKLAPDDVETELFNFYYTQEYPAQIYNDFIALRHRSNYMTKLAISHALAQSVQVRCHLYSPYTFYPYPHSPHAAHPVTRPAPPFGS